MVSSATKNLINLALAKLKLENPTKITIEEATNYIKEAINQIKKENESGTTGGEEIDEEDIPYIAINYYSPKIEDTQEVIIPFYASDFYQKEYVKDDTSENLTLRYEIDDKVGYKTIKAGDNEINFGVLNKGTHYYTLELEDSHGRKSRRICDDIWVINKEEYEIKDSETYTITDEDLSQYSINKNNSEIVEDMVNNRIGLTNLFEALHQQGYRKCILPQGIYRINRALRKGTGKDTPIVIPTNFTVDMNGATFKLHPFNDSEYGSISHVENLMVRMENCIDSHVINGTFEGDYAERQANSWLSGSNGESSNCFMSFGGEYNSLDNITITQIAGYNSALNQNDSKGNSSLGKWEDNIAVVNGVEVEKIGYTTSAISPISQAMLNNNYIICSVWLATGGIRSNYWHFKFHFYDENQNFIETITSYQYTRCKIPTNAKYFRCTFKATAGEMNGLTIHHMSSERNFVYNNCHWLDNRTCSNPNQFRHLTYLNCDFIRSGQSITSCEIDIEDGWEQAQDLFIVGCEVKESMGSANLIDNCGLNHQMINCKNFYNIFRYRIKGITVKESEGCSVNFVAGYETGNSFRCMNNNLKYYSYQDTGNFFEREKMNYVVKDCIIQGLGANAEAISVLKDCTLTTIAGDNHNFDNCILLGTNAGTGYIGSNIYEKGCTYRLAEGQTEFKFSLNKLDTKRIYENGIYECPVFFAPHNSFNSGVWNNCIFKDVVKIQTSSTTKCMGQIQFNYCTFEKDVTINSKNCEIQFNGCTFLGNITYQNGAENKVEFNETMPTVSKYVKINDHLDYVNINRSYSLSAEVLPYTATNIIPVWESNDKNIVEVDNEGNLLMKKEGTCNIIARNYENTVSDSTEIHFVDVDYNVGQYINDNGDISNFIYNVLNNRYDEVNKTNITITTPFEVNVIRVAQYDSNKNFIKLTNIQNTGTKITTGSCVLDSNCKYIRIAFRYASSTENRFPQLFAMYTIE